MGRRRLHSSRGATAPACSSRQNVSRTSRPLGVPSASWAFEIYDAKSNTLSSATSLMTRARLAKRPISRLWLNRRVQLVPIGKAHLLVGVLLVIVVGAGVLVVLDEDREQRRQPPALSG